MQFNKEWYTISEFCIHTGFCENTIKNHIKNNKIIKFKRQGRKYFIYKSELERYLNLKKEREQKYDLINEKELLDDYVTTKIFSEELNIRPETVTKLIREQKITNYKRGKKNYFIHKDEVERFKKEQTIQDDLDKNYLYPAQAINSGKYKALGKYRISEYCKNNVFKGVKEYNNSLYIPITELEKYDKFFKESYSTADAMEFLKLEKNDFNYLLDEKIISSEQINDYKIYVNKEEVKSFKNDLDKSLPLDVIARSLKISETVLKSFIQVLRLKVLTIDKTKKVLLNDSIEKIKEFKKHYYLISEVSDKYNVDSSVINRLIELKEVKATLIDNHYYRLEKSDVDQYFQTPEGVKKIYFNTDNHKEYFQKIEKAHKKVAINLENHKCYYQFVKKKLRESQSSKIKTVMSTLINCYERIVAKIEVNIEELNDNEVFEIIDSSNVDIFVSDINIFCSFLKYLKSKKACNYTKEFSIATRISENKKVDEEIYSEEEWLSIYKKANNISKHLKNSKDNYKYAQAWLYILLHLCVAWRKSDYIGAISPNIDLINIENFEWFETNQLTLEQTQTIVNDFVLKNKHRKAQKNHLKLKVIIALVESVGTALTICELHRRNYYTNSSNIFNDRFENYLNRVIDISFSSRKMNKSLLTYSFVTAVKSGERGVLAYELQSQTRSHTQYLDKSNDITKTYLSLTNTDGDFRNLSKHLFDRGFFGWQLDMILNLLFKGKDYSLEEKTRAIQELSKVCSPSMVEGLSGFVQSQHRAMYEFLNELINTPESEIIEKLEKIINGKSPSLIEHSQCFKGIDSCPNRVFKRCLGCNYLIPTNYILEIIKYRLNETIEILEDTPLTEETKCIKYTHILYRLLSILQQLKNKFDTQDSNYINSFIDLKSLLLRINNLEFKGKIIHYKSGDKIE